MDNDNLAKEITSKLLDSLKYNKMNLKIAKDLIKKCEDKARALKVPVSITVLDNGGNLVAQVRMDDSLLISIPASFNKAYTALSMKMSTKEVYNLVQPGKPFYGLESVAPGKICVFGGGVPIIKEGICIGSVGVSGGTTMQDIEISEACLS